MSVQIYIGHSGQRLEIDPSNTNTVEALRAWIGQAAGVSPRNQILLTSQGRQVRTQTLLTETELFMFDSTLLTAPKAASPTSPTSTSSQLPSPYNPGTPPDTISNQNDLQAWQNLFRVRRSWASGLLNGCGSLARLSKKHIDEQATIERSLGVAVLSLQLHVKSAEQKHAVAEQWSDEQLREQEAHLGSWEQDLESLGQIPARAEFAKFIQSQSKSARRQPADAVATSLQAFVDVPQVTKAATSAKSLVKGFTNRVEYMRNDLSSSARDSDELQHAVDQMQSRSMADSGQEPAALIEEIEIVVKKMTSDLEHVQSLPRTAQSVSQASKMALLHTRNYLPNLNEYCSEMNELVRRTAQQRKEAADRSMEHMQTLASIESQLANVYADIKGLEMPEDDQQAFATLGVVSRLPLVYGQLLVESVRRREWVTKMKKDASTLQEEMATYQEEEERRRKKWMRSVEDVVKPEALQTRALGIEVNLQNEGGSWPAVTRQELQDSLNTLEEVYGPGPVTGELDQAIKDLDKPTRKQLKHAKTFKNGSMHEAAFGTTSLMLRGDDETNSLREANLRLEQELQGQKSRVRKLEDLLHRSSHMSRASTGDMFTPQSEARTTTPLLHTPQPSDDIMRRESLRARRFSSTSQAAEEKKLARRIVSLEAELQAAKDRALSLETEAKEREQVDKERRQSVEEATATKKDLMDNMEAQQREFAGERRELEQDLKNARARVDEVEDDIERLMGSRDDERTGVEGRVASLENELEKARQELANQAQLTIAEREEKQKAQDELERVKISKAQVDAEVNRLNFASKERDEAEVERVEKLMATHTHLSPDDAAPAGMTDLTAIIEEVARRSAAHAKDLEEAIAMARSENDSLRSTQETQRNELQEAERKQTDLEDEMSQVREQAAGEEAKATSIASQLAEEQEQLRSLRSKFADGETGSEVLRQRVAEEETRAGRLSSELAEAQSHINSLDVELMRLQKKHKAYHTSAETSAERLEKRAERARDISQKLYAQHARLSRLLERLGLAISYQDGAMVIERASKVNASTNLNGDQPGILSRINTMSSPSPTRKSSTAEEPADLAFLNWPDATKPEDEEQQFEAYLQHITRFNIDTFSDAVVKRLRDFEYTAKKYNKEARESTKRADAYKERSVKLKGEAQTKIAVKDFKEGDLALFLPTRGQAKGAWAAFNIGCPHYFLAERDGMHLGSRDFIVARISRVEQRVVDLSKSIAEAHDGRSIGETSEAAMSYDDDNPFELSDGLTWYMVHAVEEKSGAPTTPGLGKSTVAAANVDARGSIRIKRSSKGDDASKTLNKSLDSRRSSSGSKKGVAGTTVNTIANANGSPVLGMNADGGAGRSRSASQVDGRPPPAAASANGTGLGIITDASSQPSSDEPTRKHSVSPVKARQRSKSPSKSIRSLARHLEPPQSPAKPVKKTSDESGVWKSLWHSEVSIESPQKGGP